MAKGYMYILECSDESYYTGSTKYLKFRIKQHQNGEGANHTSKFLPVKLVYVEEFNRIDWLLIAKNKYKVGAGRKKRL